VPVVVVAVVVGGEGKRNCWWGWWRWRSWAVLVWPVLQMYWPSQNWEVPNQESRRTCWGWVGNLQRTSRAWRRIWNAKKKDFFVERILVELLGEEERKRQAPGATVVLVVVVVVAVVVAVVVVVVAAVVGHWVVGWV
jgi:hypothetical protein